VSNILIFLAYNTNNGIINGIKQHTIARIISPMSRILGSNLNSDSFVAIFLKQETIIKQKMGFCQQYNNHNNKAANYYLKNNSLPYYCSVLYDKISFSV
jgi:amino acid permease